MSDERWIIADELRDFVAVKLPLSSVVDASPFRLPLAPLSTDLVAKYFRGLGDASRLRILELLRDEGELTVLSPKHAS
jgi:hypothetical protein